MKIQKIDIQNFKRFTNLTIEGIPASSKLVLLIGENGSGKSSIFDIFEWVSRLAKRGTHSGDEAYYKKNKDLPIKIKIELNEGKTIEKEDTKYIAGKEFAHKFYGRSSLRIVPKITNVAYNVQIMDKDADAPQTYIDYDKRFLYDVIKYTQDINRALREPVFAGQNADVSQIFKNYIEPLNKSFENIFGRSDQTVLKLIQYEDASSSKPPKLIFKKGISEINYDLLSHGEKQVVIILLNFVVRRQNFDDIIFFIDEMDAHMNTALQFNLIKEIVEHWIPDNCQLWTASHSLGFINYAKQYDLGQIIDLDQLDYDQKQTLVPITNDSLDVYEIAVPKELILEIFKNKKVIICERSDSEYYNLSLGNDKTIFIPARDSKEVFLTAKNQTSYIGLRDRGYLKDQEIEALKNTFPNLNILNLYSIENYMYHPENIDSLGLPSFNKTSYIAEIVRQKNEKIVEIASKIATARQHYEEFKFDIKNDKKVDVILNALKSDDFGDFYQYFSMKKYFAANFLASFNLSKKDLVSTNWFKEQLQTILR